METDRETEVKASKRVIGEADGNVNKRNIEDQLTRYMDIQIIGQPGKVNGSCYMGRIRDRQPDRQQEKNK